MIFTATRPLRRLLFSLLILCTFIVLSVLLEPRKRSLSCRTIWSCLNPYQHQDYQISTVPEEQQVSATETKLSDGATRFSRKLKIDAPSLLFLVLTRDGHSWSRDFQSTRRSIYDFLDLLASTNLKPQSIALGVLTGSKDEYDLLRKATDEIPLGRVTILWKNSTQANAEPGNEGATETGHGGEAIDRWKSSMALQRNYLMSRALLDEKHVVWLDAGVVEFSKGLVQKMIEHGDARTDVGIITARCVRDKADNYDVDAWALPENTALLAPTSGLDQMNGKLMLEELEKSVRTVPGLTQGTVDSDLIPLHSVGGTILYIKADLIRRGLIFPWWKVIGTTWKDAGWVGLDTGGLCYLNSQMSGNGCFVLGGTYKVRHADWG